jgi:transposase
VPRYPSGLSDGQWEVLEPQARAVMRELVIAAGRPMAHGLRAMVDAIGYAARNGIGWRALPVDFPPQDSVYAFCQRWNARGLPRALAARLRGRLRERQGRQEKPTGCITDSQMVKCADTVGKATSGYHGGKITGRGRHLIVDTEGWPLALAASVSDKAGAKLTAARLLLLFTTLQVMWADSGYDEKPLREWMLQTAGITLKS